MERSSFHVHDPQEASMGLADIMTMGIPYTKQVCTLSSQIQQQSLSIISSDAWRFRYEDWQ